MTSDNLYPVLFKGWTNEQIEIELLGESRKRNYGHVLISYELLAKYHDDGVTQAAVAKLFRVRGSVICEKYKEMEEMGYYTRKRTAARNVSRHADDHKMNKGHSVHKPWRSVA